MMFAFMVLWAYLSFSQFLIIWAGNLPDEIPWYLRRLRGGWGWVALALVIFHFATPFVLLLMREIKRNAEPLVQGVRADDRDPPGGRVLGGRAGVLQPAAQHSLDGFRDAGGRRRLVAGAFFWQLKSRPLAPLSDPRLEGAPRETVAF